MKQALRICDSRLEYLQWVESGHCGSVTAVHTVTMEVVQIVESRIKVLLFLFGALAFVAAYVFVPDPNDELPIWGGWFFGLCALVFVVLLIRPRRLTLDGNAFSISGGLAWKTVATDWADVTDFFPVSVRLGASLVGFNYTDDAKNKRRGAWVAKRLSGADGGLGGVWPCSTADLAEQLNAYRERALAQR